MPFELFHLSGRRGDAGAILVEEFLGLLAELIEIRLRRQPARGRGHDNLLPIARCPRNGRKKIIANV
jgi:hypothetical protein